MKSILMITGISHIVLYTTNMDQAINFYGKILELEIVSSSEYWSEVKVSNTDVYLGLHASEQEKDKAGTTEVSFEVRDINKAQQWLKSKNVKITREANEISPGHWVVNFDDPDGNPLSIYAIIE